MKVSASGDVDRILTYTQLVLSDELVRLLLEGVFESGLIEAVHVNGVVGLGLALDLLQNLDVLPQEAVVERDGVVEEEADVLDVELEDVRGIGVAVVRETPRRQVISPFLAIFGLCCRRYQPCNRTAARIHDPAARRQTEARSV